MADPRLEHWNKKDLPQNYAIAELVTGPLASEMLKRTLPGATTPLAIFDNASGTGIVAERILSDPSLNLEGASLLCGDISAPMIASIQEKIDRDEKWKIVTAKVIDAQDTKLPDNSFTHIFINWAIFLVPRPDDVLRECLRLLRPGGSLSFTTWAESGWLPDAQDAIKRVPGAKEIPFRSILAKSGNWDEPDWILAKITESGFIEAISEKFDFVAEAPSARKWAVSSTAGMAPLFTASWPEEVKTEHWPNFPKLYQSFLEEKYGKDKPFPYPCSAVVTVAKKPL